MSILSVVEMEMEILSRIVLHEAEKSSQPTSYVAHP